jgi:uncharacterized protein (TIGR02996 family)
MPTEEAFIAAVLADPENDAPRLIYSDWLDEQGRGERAELIRVQCELARLGNPMSEAEDSRYDILRRQEAELLDAIRADNFRLPSRFVPQIYGNSRGCNLPHGFFRRGFVHAVTCTAKAWLAHANEILACHPVLPPGIWFGSKFVGPSVFCVGLPWMNGGQ